MPSRSPMVWSRRSLALLPLLVLTAAVVATSPMPAGSAPPGVSLLTGGFPDTDSGRQIDGASTVFMGPGVDFSPGAGPERVAVPVPRGTARHLRVHAVRQPQGPNVTLTFTVMNNTAHPFNPHVPQLECSMSPQPFPSGPTLQDCEDLVDELDFDAGDRLYLKVTASSRSVPLPPPIDANAITWSVELH